VRQVVLLQLMWEAGDVGECWAWVWRAWGWNKRAGSRAVCETEDSEEVTIEATATCLLLVGMGCTLVVDPDAGVRVANGEASKLCANDASMLRYRADRKGVRIFPSLRVMWGSIWGTRLSRRGKERRKIWVDEIPAFQTWRKRRFAA